MSFIVKNLMLFDHFGGRFAFWAPKWSKFNSFYKVFWSTFPDAPKLSRTNAFLTFRKVVKGLQLSVENLMLFDHFGGLFAFGLQNDQKSTGFIRYFDQLFSMLQNALGPMLFNILQCRQTHSTFTEILMLFDNFSVVLRKWHQKYS